MLYEGSHVWGQDNWCYVVRAGRPVRTSYFRVYPDRYNLNLYDIYDNGRFLRRVGALTPAAAPAVTRQLVPEETRLLRLIYELNQQVAAANSAATYRSFAGAAGTVGGFSLGTPNLNLMTTLSNYADAIRAQGTPMANALSVIHTAITGLR
jgi:hypothetical protein